MTVAPTEGLTTGTLRDVLAAASPGGALHDAARTVAGAIAAMPPVDVAADQAEALALAR